MSLQPFEHLSLRLTAVLEHIDRDFEKYTTDEQEWFHSELILASRLRRKIKNALDKADSEDSGQASGSGAELVPGEGKDS